MTQNKPQWTTITLASGERVGSFHSWQGMRHLSLWTLRRMSLGLAGESAKEQQLARDLAGKLAS